MSLLLLMIAPLVALSGVLPVSSGAHAVVAEPWVARSGATAMTSIGHLVAAVALAVSSRHAVGRALGEARRSQPRRRAIFALPLGLVLGLAGAELLRAMTLLIRSSPLSVGLGLALTATMLATLRVAPHSEVRASGLRSSLIVGALLALSGLPGSSAIASAVVGLRWTGRSLGGSLPVAMALAAPFELRCAVGLLDGARAIDPLPLALSAACAIALAALGVVLLRRRPESTLRTATLYVATLAIAELGYAVSRIS